MKKIIITLSIIALAISNMIAGPVDQQTAQRIGEKFLKTTSLGQKTDIQLNLVSAANTKGEIDYYIFNVKGGNGFVVISGDDRVKPILAYSTEGSYSTTDVADGFRFTLNNYREEIQYVREHNIATTPDITAEWQSIEKTGYIRQNRNQRTVDILLATTWNQNYPYNSQCPEDEDGNNGHVYAGCVATAMGQVINYYNHPTRGTGSHSYTPGGWDYPSYPTQTANFGETDYHFELMPHDLDSLSTDEEIFYVAQLLHHLGISVEMMYGPDGSGAYSEYVPDALHQYFGYTQGNLIYKDGWWGGGYTNEEWAEALKGELDQNRPIYYAGQDDSGNGGHAYVCDGYDENDYFHFNWGWSGRDNAFCAIGALNTTKYAFNSSNNAILDLYPQTENYNQRPDRIEKFEIAENDSHNGVTLTWNNPANDLSGNALTSIDTVFVRRNFEVIATFTDAEVGAEMSYNDLVPESRIYEYSVFVKNSVGASIPVYQKILIGEKCDMLFQLNDSGNDGWKGAAISVVDENNNRIAIITMEDGTEQLKNVPLLRGNLRFFWNHGWYHTNEQYDTDFECSFTIMDAEGNEIFVSPSELTDGELFTYYNDCEHQMDCSAPASLTGEYVWNASDEYGVMLSWTVGSAVANRYFVYRSSDNENYEKIAEVEPGNCGMMEYFDDLSGESDITYYYKVTAYYIEGDETCESEPAKALDNPDNDYVSVVITDVNENGNAAQVYPNPTNGLLNINANGLQHITITNLLGQIVYDQNADADFITIDMNQYGNGVYMIRIETANGTSLKKVNVMK